ncbi:MAG TPA: ATP-binding protein [Candidatus Eisenbacteria bacterium]|nr:ATP-binding protein [Candidatus Eisenbacteria bacterium]
MRHAVGIVRRLAGGTDAGAESGTAAARRQEQLAALLTVSQAVTSSLDLATILRTIAEQVRQVIHVNECTVFLIEGDELAPVAMDVESYAEQVIACRLKLGEGITGAVAVSGRGEIVNDARRDPRAVQVPGTPEEDSALLCVPLCEREQPIGVITLVRMGSNGFAPEDLEVATLFAAQCSAAIAHARAYEDARAAYVELHETQAQLLQSAKLNALGEMAGGVAHDFNNILAAILGRTQLLLQTSDDPELRRQLEVIEQAALDGAQAVRRVQEFTRVRQDERFETVNMDVILASVVELTRPLWEAETKRRGVRVAVEVRPGATLPVAGNPGELREVFTNLLLNAVDALPEGGVVTIDSADRDGLVEVRVSDTGVGMDPDTCRRVFDPFFTTKTIKGTGLGLSVAWGIVSRHHGTIDVESEPGCGTTFVLRFPSGSTIASGAPASAHAPLPGREVLVVDDEEAVLHVMADMLLMLGQSVRTAPGGREAVEAIAHRMPDVVFSDLGMPEMNGWELAQAVAARAPHVPVVLVTGWGVQIDADTARRRGVERVLPKPFSVEDVERVLRELPTRGARQAA